MQTIKKQKSAITLGAPSSPTQTTIFLSLVEVSSCQGSPEAAYTCLDLDSEVWAECPGDVMEIMGISSDALTICLY